ncbi:hypothetical protein IJJ18_02700 [Candidatus Saccharibacteria bacterium]|nr:hypothetical protein [Candidatus Saccharibacteria bacterium]
MDIDESFLTEVGLQGMPEEQKNAFLAHTQDELEMRVGEKMSEGLSVEQMTEFEGIMKNDQEVIRKLILDMKKDFREDEIYQKILKKHGVAQGDWAILGEYLSVKWIQNNRPDYREIVAGVMENLKNEIRESAPQILAAA